MNLETAWTLDILEDIYFFFLANGMDNEAATIGSAKDKLAKQLEVCAPEPLATRAQEARYLS